MRLEDLRAMSPQHRTCEHERPVSEAELLGWAVELLKQRGAGEWGSQPMHYKLIPSGTLSDPENCIIVDKPGRYLVVPLPLEEK